MTFSGKITRATVDIYAKEHGLEPYQEAGIPEGFVWKKADITIGGKEIKGKIIKFKPLGDWSKDIIYE